jgi:ferredoxin
MFVFATVLLVSGIFIARPYCRFLCPYGVLLNWTSRFSKRHMTITPAHCIQCRLCEDSCPYDAIDFPTISKESPDKRVMARKLTLIAFLIPLLMLAGGWSGSLIHESLAGVNKKIILAKQIVMPDTLAGNVETFEIQAFKEQGKKQEVAFAEAKDVLEQFYLGGWLLGGFMGLVFGGLIAGRMITQHRTDYTPTKARCFSCARCMEYCPVLESDG